MLQCMKHSDRKREQRDELFNMQFLFPCPRPLSESETAAANGQVPCQTGLCSEVELYSINLKVGWTEIQVL